jgi:hypothetical protein
MVQNQDIAAHDDFKILDSFHELSVVRLGMGIVIIAKSLVSESGFVWTSESFISLRKNAQRLTLDENSNDIGGSTFETEIDSK